MNNYTVFKLPSQSLPIVPTPNIPWIGPYQNVLLKNLNNTNCGCENGSLVKDAEYIPKNVYDYINNIRFDDIYNFLKRQNISCNKLMSGDGKYFIIDKSIADLFRETGVDTKMIDYEQYDDWYITGLTKSDGTICYSMIKVREPMDDQGQKAAKVVFNEINLDSIEYAIACAKEGKTMHHVMVDTLKKDIESIVYPERKPKVHSKEMLNYFKDANSDGSYIIADFIVDKLAHDKVFEGGGTYKLPFKYEEFDDFGGKKTLDHLAEVGVYDKAKNSITIKNPDKLTKDERTALLLIQTGDKDEYAYAAENQYHADKYSNIFLKKDTIGSDAGVGESTFGSIYESKFKSESGKYYKEQFEVHGNE